MNYLIFDLVILAILVLFALRGMHRGLVLSLFSLVAVLVALVGSLLLTRLWAPSVAGWLQSTLQPVISSSVESALPEDVAQALDELSVDALPLDELHALLEEADLPMGLNDILTDVLEKMEPVSTADALVNDLASSLAEKAANAIAHVGLFLIAFLVIWILWNVLARALDLVAKFPGLHSLNKLGGFVFGALRGALILLICAWLIRWLRSDLIPAETVEQSTLLRLFMNFDPLKNFHV